MALEWRGKAGPYYYRAEWVGGRCVKTYCGSGELAASMAAWDWLEREDRQEARARERAKKRAGLEAQRAEGQPVVELVEAIDRLTAAALVAAGCHRHDRGRWRVRR